jgi:hypothetical protein
VGPSRRRKTRRRKGRIKWGNVCILYGYGANGGTERRDRVLFKRSVFALSKHVIRYCVVCKCCRNQGTCFSCACLLSFNMQTAIPFLQLYARTETPLLNPLSALPLSSPPTSLPLHLSIKRNRRPRRTRRRTISRQIPPPPKSPGIHLVSNNPAEFGISDTQSWYQNVAQSGRTQIPWLASVPCLCER